MDEDYSPVSSCLLLWSLEIAYRRAKYLGNTLVMMVDLK